MAAYSMPFHMRDVLGSYPSAQLAAVDRDTQIFRYGQIFQNTKNPNKRLVAARTLAGISPGYQEARIEQLAGDNFSQRAFQAEQREAMALQKKYIQDRSEYMEQKTNNRLLRGTLVEALARGGRSTGDRTPFADLDLDENFDVAGRGSMGSGTTTGASTPRSGGGMSTTQLAEIMGRMEAFPQSSGLSESFWQGRGSAAGSVSGESEASWLSQEYGMGVEPVNVNLDPTFLQNIQLMRAASSEERARMEVVGSLVGEMVSDVAGFQAYQQEQERQAGVRQLMYETGIMDVQNPADFSEADLRIVARANEEARRRGFFGRAEMAADETFMEQPLEIESAEMGMEPGGRSLQEMLGTVDEFGSRGSLALASGGGAARRGRPAGFRVSEESKARRAQTLEEQRRWVEEQEAMGVEFGGGMRRKMSLAKTALSSGRLEGRAAEAAIARMPGRGIVRPEPKGEEQFPFSLFD